MKKNYFLFALLGAGFCIQNPVMASEVSGNESVKMSAVMPVADVPQTVKPFKGQWYSLLGTKLTYLPSTKKSR